MTHCQMFPTPPGTNGGISWVVLISVQNGEVKIIDYIWLKVCQKTRSMHLSMLRIFLMWGWPSATTVMINCLIFIVIYWKYYGFVEDLPWNTAGNSGEHFRMDCGGVARVRHSFQLRLVFLVLVLFTPLPAHIEGSVWALTTMLILLLEPISHYQFLIYK